MSLIDVTYFEGEITIANRSQPEVQEALQILIDKYEPKFLNLLLGSTAVLFRTALLEEIIEGRWSVLMGDTNLKQAIANYVYYWYMRNNATQTVGIGEVIPAAENATVVSAAAKMVRAWNEMVDYCREFTLDATIYPEWETTYMRTWDNHRGYVWPEIFVKINTLNI